jgi:hypothetical protein
MTERVMVDAGIPWSTFYINGLPGYEAFVHHITNRTDKSMLNKT